jgi:hypothetical protein
MTQMNGTRGESVARYDDRRPVSGRALMPAIAAGLGAGLVVFYVARLLAERAPMELEPIPERPDRDGAPARTRG